jgi:hypothetical protein
MKFFGVLTIIGALLGAMLIFYGFSRAMMPGGNDMAILIPAVLAVAITVLPYCTARAFELLRR